MDALYSIVTFFTTGGMAAGIAADVLGESNIRPVRPIPTATSSAIRSTS